MNLCRLKEKILQPIISFIYYEENPDWVEDKLEGLLNEYNEHHYMSSIIYRQNDMCIAICTYEHNMKDPYMIVYNYMYEEYATKCARISMVKPEYLQFKSTLSKKRWVLKDTDIEQLIEILNSNLPLKSETVWDSVKKKWMFITESGIDISDLGIPDYTKLK